MKIASPYSLDRGIPALDLVSLLDTQYLPPFHLVARDQKFWQAALVWTNLNYIFILSFNHNMLMYSENIFRQSWNLPYLLIYV